MAHQHNVQPKQGMEAFTRSKLAHAVDMLEGNTQACKQLMDDIWAAGSQETRQFHHPRHFLKVSGGMTPIRTPEEAVRFIAGQCHDVVYYKADGGFEPHIEKAIKPYFTENNGTFTIAQNNDVMFKAAQVIFGYKTGDTLSPFGGQNEFLSALYAMKMSDKEHLNLAPKYQLMVMTHIEGTVPFRSENHFEKLHDRLTEANKFLFPVQRLSAKKITETIHTAVAMANQDVSGFDQDYNKFFQDTCKLVLEFIPPEKRTDPHAIRVECQNQINFLSFLGAASEKNEKKIVHGFQGVPSQNELDSRDTKARDNISKTVVDLVKEETIAAILQMSKRPCRSIV
jgi:hypothetical protein